MIVYQQLVLSLHHRYVEIPLELDEELRKMNVAELEYLTNSALESASLDAFRKTVEVLQRSTPNTDIQP